MAFVTKQKASSHVVRRSALTLAEALMATIVVVCVGAFAIPTAYDMMERTALRSAGDALAQAARTAQDRARAEKDVAVPWGVHAGLGMLFNGRTLAESTIQESITYPPSVTVSGVAQTMDGLLIDAQEMQFDASSGRPGVVVNGSVRPVRQLMFTLRSVDGLREMVFVCPNTTFTTGILLPGRAENAGCEEAHDAAAHSVARMPASAAALPSQPSVRLSAAEYRAHAGIVVIGILRGSGTGPASADYEVRRRSASAPGGVVAQGTVFFSGDTDDEQLQEFVVTIPENGGVDGDEEWSVSLTNTSGNVVVALPSTASIFRAHAAASSSGAVMQASSSAASAHGASQPVAVSRSSAPSSCIRDALENFEDRTLASFVTGTPGWIVAPAGYSGAYAAQAGKIRNTATTTLAYDVRATAASVVQFAWKVSSEEHYDFLCFYVDGVKQGCISGEADWRNYPAHPLSPGAHTLQWTYFKDASRSAGSDTGWVDAISVRSVDLCAEDAKHPSSPASDMPNTCTTETCGACTVTPTAFIVAGMDGYFAHNSPICGITAPATAYPAMDADCQALNERVGSPMLQQGSCQWADASDFMTRCFNDVSPYDASPPYRSEGWILRYLAGRWELYPAGQSTMRYVHRGPWDCTSSVDFTRDQTQTDPSMQACSAYPMTITVAPTFACH